MYSAFFAKLRVPLAGFFTFLFLVPIIFFSLPKESDAFLGITFNWPISPTQITHDVNAVAIQSPANVGTAVSTGVTAGATVGQLHLSLAEWIKKYVLDPLAIAVARGIIRQLTAQTVKWINSGFKGNPAYVTNPEQFFLSVGDNAVAQYISSSKYLSQLCSPFSAQVRLSLVKNYLNDQTVAACSLGKIEQNFDQFTRNFNSGGWEAWFSMTQTSTNNPYGAYVVGRDQLTAQIGTQQNHYSTQLNQNKGFLSWETCSADNSTTGVTEGSKRTVCLQYGSSATPNTTTVTGPDGLPLKTATVGSYSNSGLACVQSDIQVYTGGKWVSQGSLGTVDTSTNGVLADCPSGQTRVNTPGSVIESQLENQLGSGVRQLELTNSINQVVSALMTELIGQVVGGIGNGLRGASQSTSSNGPSLIDKLAANPTDNTAAAQQVAKENADLLNSISQTTGSLVPELASSTNTTASTTVFYTPPSDDQIQQTIDQKTAPAIAQAEADATNQGSSSNVCNGQTYQQCPTGSTFACSLDGNATCNTP